MVSIPRTFGSRSIELNGGVGGIVAPERYVKHPLQNEWTLWYLEFQRNTSWEDMQNKVTTFKTVEDFWCLQNNIVDASGLGDLNDYSLFKGDIRPMWEDKANYHGGRWILSFNKQHRPQDLDEMWLDTMLYIIGGTSEYIDEITGAVVNVRNRGHKISVWTANSKNNNAVHGIGSELKRYLGTEAKIVYEPHHGSKSSKSNLLTL